MIFGEYTQSLSSCKPFLFLEIHASTIITVEAIFAILEKLPCFEKLTALLSEATHHMAKCNITHNKSLKSHLPVLLNKILHII